MKAYVYYVETEDNKSDRTRVIFENGEAYYLHTSSLMQFGGISKCCFAKSAWCDNFRDVKIKADRFDEICGFKSTLVATINLE